MHHLLLWFRNYPLLWKKLYSIFEPAIYDIFPSHRYGHLLVKITFEFIYILLYFKFIVCVFPVIETMSIQTELLESHKKNSLATFRITGKSLLNISTAKKLIFCFLRSDIEIVMFLEFHVKPNNSPHFVNKSLMLA